MSDLRQQYMTVLAALTVTGMAMAPPAHADATQASAEQAVQQVYNQVQTRCTPSMPPHFQRIVWNNFNGNIGSGRIIDATPALGGPFQIFWDTTQAQMPGAFKEPAQPQGFWDVKLEFC